MLRDTFTALVLFPFSSGFLTGSLALGYLWYLMLVLWKTSKYKLNTKSSQARFPIPGVLGCPLRPWCQLNWLITSPFWWVRVTGEHPVSSAWSIRTPLHTWLTLVSSLHSWMTQIWCDFYLGSGGTLGYRVTSYLLQPFLHQAFHLDSIYFCALLGLFGRPGVLLT